MKRLFPIIVLGPLVLGGTALAQQIDPPSLQIDVGPGDIDVAIAEAHEAIASGISEALVTTAGDILDPDDDGDGIPDIIDPDNDPDEIPGVSKLLHDTAMAIIRKIGG